MRMTVILQLNGRSIQIPCGGCGLQLRISLLRPRVPSTSSPGTEHLESRHGLHDKDDLRLLIESVPTEAVPQQE